MERAWQMAGKHVISLWQVGNVPSGSKYLIIIYLPKTSTIITLIIGYLDPLGQAWRREIDSIISSRLNMG